MTGSVSVDASVGWVRRIGRSVMVYRRNVILAFGAALLGTLVTAAVPLVERQVIDNVVVAHRHSLTPYLIVLIASAFAIFGLAFVRRYFGGVLSLDVQYDLRDQVFATIEGLDGARQDQVSTGQVVSRAISDVGAVQGLLSYLPMITGNLVLFVASIVAMAWLSPMLTLIALAMGPALYVLGYRSRSTVFPATWAAQQQAGEVAGAVEEAVAGVRVVKGFGQESRELDRIAAHARWLFALRMRAVWITSRFAAAMQAVPALGQVAVLALGGWLALTDRITLGTFLAFSTYLGALIGPTRTLAGLLTVGQQAKASTVRIFEIIDSRSTITDAPDATTLHPDDVRGLVELDGVTFGYRPGQPVLRDISLRVEPGETVALVGTSGSGKSTISQLLPRFYDPQAGAVRLDGHDVRTLTIASVRAQLGVVFEDSFLFSDSVRANIAYGRPDATDEQIVAAARAAQADGFITALPNGYDTVVGEQGLTLSGGQRQRVALARALLTDPRVLILDDATSAVDARIEAEIHNTLREVMRGRTTLLIAHRRSTLHLADRIAVLDAGRIVDLGTEDELAERSPLFRRLLAGPGDTLADDTADQSGPAPLQPSQPADAKPHAGDGTSTSTGSTTEKANGGRQDTGADAAGIVGRGTGVAGSGGRGPSGSGFGGTTAAQGIGGGTPRQGFDGGPPGRGFGGGAAGRGMGGGFAARAMNGGGAFGDLPPTPELLARVDALPPAEDDPRIDQAAAAEPDPGFTLARLLRWVRVPLVVGLLLVALDTVAGLALPALVRHAVDAGVSAGARDVLFATAGVALAITLADWVVQIWQTRVTGRMGERLLYVLRVKTFAQLQRLGLDYYERELAGRIMTRMTTDVDALSTFLQTGLTTAIVSLLSFFGVMIALLILDIELALVVMAVLPVLIVATIVFRARSSAAYTEARERVSAVNASLQENLTGLRVAQAFGREDVNQQRFRELADAYRRSRARAQRMIASYFPFVEFLSRIALALVLGVGAHLVVRGSLTAGGLLAFMLYVNLFFSPVQQLSQVFDGYQQAMVGLRRLSDLLRTPTSTPPAEHPRPVEGRLSGEIVLDDVRFAYTLASRSDGETRTRLAPTNAVDGVSLRIAPGETVAFVGETGAGKSSVLKLIARYYDVTGGAIRIDGVDVREFDLSSYRRRLGVVPQEPFVFSGTVRDAIAYARPDATDDQVREAARAVGADTFIATLPDGYDHPVGERGRGLSAGQRQLLALARAELADPDILLFDEATAALDLATEAAVTAAAEALATRRTTVVIAHRLTTAARADRVVVMADGRIAEQGTHDELVQAGGVYARLWAVFTAEGAPGITGAGHSAMA